MRPLDLPLSLQLRVMHATLPLSSRENGATSFCSSQAAVLSKKRVNRSRCSTDAMASLDDFRNGKEGRKVETPPQPAQRSMCASARHASCIMRGAEEVIGAVVSRYHVKLMMHR